MKVPFIVASNELQLMDVEQPRAGPADVVVKVASAGICGTDLGLLGMGGVGGRPTPLGHELAGTAVEVGDEVTTVRVGDRVVLNPLVNMIGNGGPEGGFADYLLVREVATKPGSLLALPDDMSFDMGAIVEPIAVAMHATARLAAKCGDKVAIFGAGAIGLATIAVLRHRGVEDIVVFDLSAFRRSRAEAIGATRTADPGEVDPYAVLVEQHGGVKSFAGELPATTHFVEASGAPITPEIIAKAAPHSTICVIALHKKPEPVEFRHVMAKELTIIGTMGYPEEFQDALDLVRSGTVDLEPMISHRFGRDEVLDAFEMARRTDESAKVLIRFDI